MKRVNFDSLRETFLLKRLKVRFQGELKNKYFNSKIQSFEENHHLVIFIVKQSQLDSSS